VSLESNAIPQLAPGCRVRNTAEEAILLVPEGILKLQGSAAEILSLIDGQRSIHEIVSELCGQYGSDATEQIATEVQNFLERLHTRSVLSFSGLI
jgi:pyrroloquinoline quinone biosynthesis protein D